MRRKRVRVTATEEGGSYFAAPSDVATWSSGCALLDLVLAGSPGGWAERRIINIVGDRSTGKTLLAIEAMANYRRKHPKHSLWYVECEAAFSKEYAAHLGMPIKAVQFPEEIRTVEDFFKFLSDLLDKGAEGLVVLDSLDAISDDAEMARDINKGSFGAEKAKKMSTLFRRLTKRIAESGMTVIIISQVRDKIGVTFGKSTTRSGGRALDFYASQVIWLAHLKRLVFTTKGQSRPAGVRVRAKCEKNKVSMPFRECDFPIFFGFGVDDVLASLEWLIEVKSVERAGLTMKAAKLMVKKIRTMREADWVAWRETLTGAVRIEWLEMERRLMRSFQKPLL